MIFPGKVNKLAAGAPEFTHRRQSKGHQLLHQPAVYLYSKGALWHGTGANLEVTDARLCPSFVLRLGCGNKRMLAYLPVETFSIKPAQTCAHAWDLRLTAPWATSMAPE